MADTKSQKTVQSQPEMNVQSPDEPSQAAGTPLAPPPVMAQPPEDGGMSPRSKRWNERRAKMHSMQIQHVVSYKNEDRCVLTLRDDAFQFRERQRQWAVLQAELADLENSFDSVWVHKQKLEADFHSRQLKNVTVIEDMRNQVTREKSQNASLKLQCVNSYRDNDEQRLRLDELLYEVSKHKCDFDREKCTNELRQTELKNLNDERAQLNEVNANDANEITRLTAGVSKAEAECRSLTSQGDALDMSVKNQLQVVETTSNRLIDKSNELTQKDAEMMAATAEIHHLNDQIAQFQSHVSYLKSCQEKTSVENNDIQARIDAESAKNAELTNIIRDIEIKIKAKEDQVVFLCNSINQARQVNATSLDNNSNLQAEMEGVSNHISVMSNQNKALSVELDQFSAANEAMRAQLDRRHRVAQVMERNDLTIADSTNYVQHTVAVSRSPVRHHIVEARPCLPPPMFEHRVVEEKRTPVEWRVERSIDRRLVGERLMGPPVHPYNTYTQSYASSGPGMTAQTNDTKQAEDRRAAD